MRRENQNGAFSDELTNLSLAPGYRNLNLHLKVCTSSFDKDATENIAILLNKDDAWQLLLGLIDAQKTAWRTSRPIDAEASERCPPLIKHLLERDAKL